VTQHRWAPYDAWMDEPLRLAQACLPHGDVPVGAVVCDADGVVIGTGHNVRERDGDPAGHAEIVALRAAARTRNDTGAGRHDIDDDSRPSWRLDGCTLVVTLEPCVMCTGALIQSRVDRVVFGAWDDKAGACGSVWDLARDRASLHRVEVVSGVREAECAALLREFFRTRREP